MKSPPPSPAPLSILALLLRPLGHWSLDIGYWILNIEYSISNFAHRILSSPPSPRSPRPLRPLLLPLLLAAALLCACSPKTQAPLPSLSDPSAGLSLVLPPSASSFARPSAGADRFLSRIPYGNGHTLLYLHVYSTPLVDPSEPPALFDDVAEAVLRDELGAFLTLETAYTNLPDQTPAVLLYGRARDPDNVAGFAFQCNKTHFVFLGLSGPDVAPADTDAFFQSSAPNLRISPLPDTTFADAAQYQSQLVDVSNPAQSIEFVRNFFAARNANPRNYSVAIGFAYLLAQDLRRSAPDSPLLDEILALLDNMSSIRLADYLKARRDFEIAYGQRNAPEAIAQARFLDALSFPFDAEAKSLASQRIRKANRLQ